MRANAEATFDITKSIFAVLEYKRPEISFCGVHVLFLTENFYERLPFGVRLRIDYDQLRYGALLHDIGKIALPEEILNKAGKLEAEEMDIMRSHTDISARMLANIPGLEPVSKWIQYHHERMDGKGYYKLKGHEIPLEARLIAITDAYSSIVMPSAFKPSRTHEDAISVLRMGSGEQFDPELVELFCQLPSKNLNEATERAMKMMKTTKKCFPKEEW